MALLSQAGETLQKMNLLAALGFLVVAPFLVARVAFQLAQAHLPAWFRLIIVAVLFIALFIWAWLISGKRGEQLFTNLYEQGFKWFVLISVSMLLFAVVPFAALSSILADLGYTTFEPSVPEGEFWIIHDLYLWHFFESVPSLKIPPTLLWKEPLHYKDHLSGALILTFKIIVIAPVIASFTTWRKLNKNAHSDPKIGAP